MLIGDYFTFRLLVRRQDLFLSSFFRYLECSGIFQCDIEKNMVFSILAVSIVSMAGFAIARMPASKR